MSGEVVRAHRRGLGLSQEELAARSGVSVRGLRKIESNRAVPRPSTVRLLADAFGLAGAERASFAEAMLRPVADRPIAARGPAQLPMSVSAFTGRDAELDQLHALTRPATFDTARLAIISGTPGVGKTALAVHWAHRVRRAFPDGQLYVDLRGYDPDLPMSPARALAGFLTALGVAGRDIPPDVEEQAGRYRTETADKRILVVLDNAASAEQVRPLLPGAGGSAVLVTSRDSLAGLIATRGGRRIELDLLPRDDAIALLRRLIGPRADADPDAAAELIRQCARLPLALRLAAELAAARAAMPLRDLVAELADQHALHALGGAGDPRAELRAVFSWSVRHLSPGASEVFALLGLHPGADFDVSAAAALSGANPVSTAGVLAELTRAKLLEAAPGRRYSMHDLLRRYARDLAATLDGRSAVGRLLDHYRDTAARVVRIAYPPEAAGRESATALAVTPGSDWKQAVAWLEEERRNLTAVAEYAAEHDWPAHAVALSGALYRYLANNHHGDAFSIHGHAVRSARRIGDPDGEAQALLGLATAHMQIGRYGPAAGTLEEALAAYRQAGDRHGEARALTNLGVTAYRLGHHQVAAEHLHTALAIFQAGDDDVDEARALTTLAVIEQRLGHHEPARSHLHRALTLFLDAGNRTGAAHALNNLATTEVAMNRYDDATQHLQQARTLFRELGDQRGEAGALEGLGTVHARRQECEQATGYLDQALSMFRGVGDRYGESWTLNSLGEALRDPDCERRALAHHSAALAIARDHGFDGERARAHAGIAAALHAAGDLPGARDHYAQALDTYTALGMPEADAVRARLAALDVHRTGHNTTG